MAATKPQAHFAYIDALRGYAILGVVVVHTGGAIGLGPAIWWGARGVQLFFVVSALTLTHTWYSRSDGVAAFFVRRIFRIVPMFWLAIAYYLAGNGAVGAWQILASVTLLHGLHPESIMSIVPGGWSISDEALFYLAFPLLAAMLTTWARAAVALALALAAAVWWRRHGIALMQPAALTPQSLSDFVFCSMPGQLPAFAAGFLAFHTIRKFEATAACWASNAALIAALLALALQFSSDFQDVPRVSVLFGIIVTTMGLGAGRYLVNAVTMYIGKISYSAYFIHFALLGYAHDLVETLGLSGAPGFAVAFACVAIPTIAISTVTYFVIEQPFIEIGRALLRRAHPSTEIAAAG